MRFILVLAALAFASPAFADLSVGTIDDGYVYRGAGLWQNGAGDYFTRSKVYWGYTYSNYYGSYPQYYYWSYTAASKPASSLTADSSDKDWLDFAKSRERAQGAIALQKTKDDGFLAKAKLFGISPPFPALPGYTGAFNFGSSTLGSYGFTGNTLYGYQAYPFSVNQTAEIYGPIDPNVAVLQFGNAVRALNGASQDATNGLGTIAREANATAERLASLRIDRSAELERIRAVLPSRISTTVQGISPKPVDPAQITPAPATMPGAEETRVMTSETAKNSCISCHSGSAPKGNLDMTKGLTAAQYLRIINRVTLPSDDTHHMPPPQNGKAIQLNALQIEDLLPLAKK